jgi:tetratricopeptide (TPR) repeat protein
MDQQGGESTGGRIPNQRVTLPLSDAARASLLAVRSAQEAARARARRETARARGWLLGIAGGIAVGLFVFGPRVGRRHGAQAARPVPASVATTVPAGGFGRPPAPQVQTAPDPVKEPVARSAPLPVLATPLAAPPIIPASAAELAALDSACAETFGQRRWRISIETCTKAFEARPQDAALALRIAHAHHARARLPDAEQWANRAITLDPSLAEAFVIVAHAETHAGNPSAAAEAYRRYLALAPRGWHASEARAAVRAKAREEHAARDSISSPG